MTRSAQIREIKAHGVPVMGRSSKGSRKCLVFLYDVGQAANIEALRHRIESERSAIANIDHLCLEVDGADSRSAWGRQRARIFNVLESLLKQGYSSRDIFLFGCGRGASVAMDLSLNYQRPLAGVIVSGSLGQLEENWRKSLAGSAFHTPRLIIDGLLEDTLAIPDVRAAMGELQSVGLPLTYENMSKGRTLDAETALSLSAKWVLISHWMKSQISHQALVLAHQPQLHEPSSRRSKTVTAKSVNTKAIAAKSIAQMSSSKS